MAQPVDRCVEQAQVPRRVRGSPRRRSDRPAERNPRIEEKSQHMPDVLAVPGFTAAQRYRLAPDPDLPGAPTRFLTIYEMECDDRAAVMAEVRCRAGTVQMPLFPGGGKSAPTTIFAEAVTDRLLAPAAE